MQSKSLYIAEKPSVAKEFAKVLNVGGRASDGYLESADAVVTWCVGHLVTMSYPEVYDPKLKKWSLDTLPFLPEEFKYELIDDVKKQFRIVERLLNREDVTCIYVCTDPGRKRCCLFQSCSLRLLLHEYQCHHNRWPSGQY